MLKKTAEIISFIFNPLVLVFCLILLGMDKSDLPQRETLVFTLGILILNGLAPVYFYLETLRRKIVFDDILKNPAVLKNRPMVLAWWMILFLVEIFLVRLWGNVEPLFYILVILFALTLVLFLVSLSKKISLHMAYSTLFALLIIYVFGWAFWPILILIPLVAWSRYYSMRHTWKQLIAGFLASVLTGTIFYLLLIKF